MKLVKDSELDVLPLTPPTGEIFSLKTWFENILTCQPMSGPIGQTYSLRVRYDDSDDEEKSICHITES